MIEYYIQIFGTVDNINSHKPQVDMLWGGVTQPGEPGENSGKVREKPPGPCVL